MSHRRPTALRLVALAGFALVLGACTSTSSGTTGSADATTSTADPTPAQPSDSPTGTTSHAAIDLTQVRQDTALDPGTYSVGLLFDEGPTRALVDVPLGYHADGEVIGSDGGDLAFWGSVTKVDTDPCLGGKLVGAGTSVHDLVTRLVALRHMKVSQPEPVTVGGFHGVHLRLTAPASLDRCRDGNVTIFTAGGPWLQWDIPGAAFHEWILDVHGTRVVGGARIDPGAAKPDELIHMVESATFTGTGKQ